MTEPMMITRAFAGPLELADETGDGRTIAGRCVPYDVPALVADPNEPEPYFEVWKRGVFKNQIKAPNRVPLVFAHREGFADQIGRGVDFTDAPDGLEATFRLWPDAAANAREMIRDGTCAGLSIHAAVPVSGSRRRPDGTVERRSARLIHVALVGEPAFADAHVTAIRAAGDGPPPAGILEIRAIQDRLRLRFRADD